MLSTLQQVTFESRPGPALESISVADFLKEAWDDYNSPTTSAFVSRIGQCRATATNLEEVGGALWCSQTTGVDPGQEGSDLCGTNGGSSIIRSLDSLKAFFSMNLHRR